MRNFLLLMISGIYIGGFNTAFADKLCYNPKKLSMPARAKERGSDWEKELNDTWKEAKNTPIDRRKKYYGVYFLKNNGKAIEIASVERKPAFLLQLIIDTALEQNDNVCFVVDSSPIRNEYDLNKNVSLESGKNNYEVATDKLEWKNSDFSQYGEKCRELIGESKQGLMCCNREQTHLVNMWLAKAEDNQKLKIDLGHFFGRKTSDLQCSCRHIPASQRNPFFEKIKCPKFIFLKPLSETSNRSN